MKNARNEVVLVVDDDAGVLKSVTYLLSDKYAVVACCSAEDAFSRAGNHDLSAILSDVKMPSISGLELLERMHQIVPDVPVILMTAYAEMDSALKAIKNKAFDFIIKPFDPDLLLETVDRAVQSRREVLMDREFREMLKAAVEEKSVELARAHDMVKGMSIEVVQRLTAAAECRDNDTGTHIVRLGIYARELAVALGCDEDMVQRLELASQMHDIGKIGIPDSILLKQAPLSSGEYEIMKQHTMIGERILSGSPTPVLRTAALIAISHHERWDGTGYPYRLKEEDIPLEGRIVFLCDQYDAMRSRRPYKAAFTHDRALEIITYGDGRSLPQHFDPDILKAFSLMHRTFDDIFTRNQ